MIHTIKWSRASACSLAGCDVTYIVYLPGYGAFGALIGAEVGDPYSLDREAKIKKVYDDIASFQKDIDGLIITCTNNPKAAKQAVKKIMANGPRGTWYMRA